MILGSKHVGAILIVLI